MSFIKYEKYVEGKVSGSACVVSTVYDKDNAHKSRQTRGFLLGAIVQKTSTTSGVFLHDELGLIGYDLASPDLFFAVKQEDYPILNNLKISPSSVVYIGGTITLYTLLFKKKYFDLFKKCIENDQERNLLIALIFHHFLKFKKRETITTFLERDLFGHLFPNLMISSQMISSLFATLGNSNFKTLFFKNYLPMIKADADGKIVTDIDSTGLENSIDVPLNRFTTHGSNSGDQIRMMLVMQRKTNKPLWFKTLPGNQIDNTSLMELFNELGHLGLKIDEVFLDCGYFSEQNVKLLISQNAEFTLRISPNENIYKQRFPEILEKQEDPNYEIILDDKIYFGLKTEVTFKAEIDGELVSKTHYVFSFIDFIKRASEYNVYSLNCSDIVSNDEKKNVRFRSGLFMIYSSKNSEPLEILKQYRSRDRVEKLFKKSKGENELLPIKKQTELTIEGHIMFSFLLMTINVDIDNLMTNSKITLDELMARLSLYKGIIKDEEIQKTYVNNKAVEAARLLGVGLGRYHGKIKISDIVRQINGI
jgi:hypothetical protein